MAGRFKGTEPGLKRGAQTGRPKQARNALFQDLRSKEKTNEPNSNLPFGKTIALVKKKRKPAPKPDGGDGEPM